MKIRATLIELWDRFTHYDEVDEIYHNGLNNLYPNEIERVVQNSPTGSKASNIMSKYLVGKGLTNDPVLNGTLLSETTKDVSDDISMQYGSFVHVTYGMKIVGSDFTFEPIGIKCLDYTKCRKQKNDDDGNRGIIMYKNFEAIKSWYTKNEDETFYYPYSNDQNVIREQIKRDSEERLKQNPDMNWVEMLAQFRGQVYYLNLTPRYEYAVSLFNSVYNDADTEYRMSLYSNSISRLGFLGKIAILTSGLDEETSNTIKDDVKGWLGAENASTTYFLEIEDTEDLEKNFKIINVPSQYDEAQFRDTKENVRINILGAINNIPSALAYGRDNALFGNSGELILQMKLFYQEQTSWERKKIEEMYSMFGWETEIVLLVEEPIIIEEKIEP